ncbi:UNVERIFIED_CONTAM: hypothetical protein FKN15_028037 [Acipenser sinensis]
MSSPDLSRLAPVGSQILNVAPLGHSMHPLLQRSPAQRGSERGADTNKQGDEDRLLYKITDIIGKEEGLGVENLRGSGMIAGESSLAYEEIITMNLVTCRAIGIGAYLVRLGQRTIQVENSHIILTGAGALNKVLGREVYTSNNQLGGIQIMHNNGVTHSTVCDDFEGVYTLLQWLSYMPKCNSSPVPILSPKDPIDRPVDFVPTKAPYDPRWMLSGRPHQNMYDQVLKFGAYIVDGLREYRQPVLVYIPPQAELRGGSWVVIDPTINPRHMEMYADRDSRGGVLEPEGTVEIKFRKKDLVKTMRRVDPVYSKLAERLGELLKSSFQDILEWRTSRQFFYWRLRRLLLEDTVHKKIQSANAELTNGQIQAMLRRWFVEAEGAVKAYLWDNNKDVVEWLEKQLAEEEGARSVIDENIKYISRDYILKQIRSLVQANPEVAMDSIVHMTQHISPTQRAEIVRILSTMDTPMDTPPST